MEGGYTQLVCMATTRDGVTFRFVLNSNVVHSMEYLHEHQEVSCEP